MNKGVIIMDVKEWLASEFPYVSEFPYGLWSILHSGERVWEGSPDTGRWDSVVPTVSKIKNRLIYWKRFSIHAGNSYRSYGLEYDWDDVVFASDLDTEWLKEINRLEQEINSIINKTFGIVGVDEERMLKQGDSNE